MHAPRVLSFWARSLLAAAVFLSTSVRADGGAERAVELREVARLVAHAAPGVAAAERRARAAHARERVAHGAYWPRFDAQAEYAALQQQQLYFIPRAANERSEATTTRASVNGRLEWLLTDFGGRAAEVQRAASYLRAARSEAIAVRFAGVRAASEYFIELLTTQRLRENAAISVTRRQAVSRAIARLIDAGLRPRVDLQRADIEAVAAQTALLVLAAQASVQSSRLAASMGLEPELAIHATAPADELLSSIDSEDAARRSAELRRPELRAQEARIDAQRAGRLVSRARLLPSINLYVSSNFQRDSLQRGVSVQGDAFIAMAGIALRFSPLDVPALRSMHAVSAELDVERWVLREVALRTHAAAITNRREVARAREALSQADQIFAAAHSTREAQYRRYEVGEASLIELLDAEDVEQEARSRRILAQRDVELSRIALLDAMGLLESRLLGQ